MNLEEFSAADMGLFRWKKRNNVGGRCGTHSSQRIPRDYQEQLFNYRKDILQSRQRHVYTVGTYRIWVKPW